MISSNTLLSSILISKQLVPLFSYLSNECLTKSVLVKGRLEREKITEVYRISFWGLRLRRGTFRPSGLDLDSEYGHK